MQTLKKFYIGLMLIVMVIISDAVYADERKALHAVFTTWEPYGYVENGKAVGLEIEIFDAVMKKMNIQVEFLHQPWKRCLHSMKYGMADAIISALKTSEREAYMYFPREPISISKTALFTAIDKNIEFNGSYETLKGFTIGVASGFSYGPGFDDADFLNKDGSTKPEAVIKKVVMGRNELGIGNIAVIRSIARKNNSSHKIRFLKPLVHSEKLYVGFSKAKEHEKLAGDFSKVLSEFRKSAEYKAILKKYGTE